MAKKWTEDELEGWSIRIYKDGHATAKKDSELIHAESDDEIREKIMELENSDNDNNDDVEDEIRTELENSFSDSDVIDELLPDLVSMYKYFENSDDDEYDDNLSFVKSCIGVLASYYNDDGHSLTFIKTALGDESDYGLWQDGEDSIYSEMDDDDIREDIEHRMDFFDFSDATKEFMEKEMADGGLDGSYFNTAEEFEETYKKALAECGDEYMASRYAELTVNGEEVYQHPEAVCEPSKSLGSCECDADCAEFIEEKYGIEVLKYSDGEVIFIDDSIIVVTTFDSVSEEISNSEPVSFYLDTEENRKELGV